MKTSIVLIPILCCLSLFLSCTGPSTIFRPNFDFDTIQFAYIVEPEFEANFIFLNVEEEMDIFQDELIQRSGFERIESYLAPPDTSFQEDVQIFLRLVDFGDSTTDRDSCHILNYYATIRCDLYFPKEDRTESFEKSGSGRDSSCRDGRVSVSRTQENAIKSALKSVAQYFRRGF